MMVTRTKHTTTAVATSDGEPIHPGDSVLVGARYVAHRAIEMSHNDKIFLMTACRLKIDETARRVGIDTTPAPQTCYRCGGSKASARVKNRSVVRRWTAP